MFAKDLSPRRSHRALAGIFVMSILFAINASGSSLEDYQKRLADVQVYLDQIRSTDKGNNSSARSVDVLIAMVQTAVPPTEKVEWPGGSLDTGNQWLQAGLDQFKGEYNLSKRRATLDQLDQRIAAIRESISELEQSNAEVSSKDADKQKLAEILRRPEYQPESRGDESLFQRWSRQILEWLSRMFPRVNMPQQEPGGLSSLSFLLQVSLYLLLAAGLGYLAYRVLPVFRGRFGGGDKTLKNGRVIMGERISDDQSAHDVFADAETLARSGQLRLAIRKGYIALLCDLNDRKIIGLARHKTNRDYLRDVRSRRELFANVSGLTSSFERHWYGTQSSQDGDWAEFRELYQKAIREA